MPIINQIVKGGGTTPTGTKNITANGVHDVAGYANADVQVPTTAPAHYVEKSVDANGKLINSGNMIDLTGVTDVGDYALCYTYLNCIFPANTHINMSPLPKISGNYACQYMFQSCKGITSVDLSGLTTVSGGGGCQYMFQNCTSITSVDLSSLTTLSGGSACNTMFQNCTSLTSVNLSGLTTLSSYSACGKMFEGTGLTSIDLPALTTISGSSAMSQMFRKCTSLATVYIGGTTAIDFGTYTNQFADMFNGCTQNIDVYAPAANQAQIEAFSGYPNFGGTGTVTWHWRS